MPKEKEKKILFVSHKTNMSGAPILLLEIIKECKQRSNAPFEILIIEDGVLTKEFESLGKTHLWPQPKVNKMGKLLAPVHFIFFRLLTIIQVAYILFKIRKTSVVFFNTIINGAIQKKMLFLQCKFICFVHELEAAIRIATNPNSLSVVINNTHLFLAASEAVKSNLIINQHVKKEIIEVANYCMTNVYRNKNDYADFTASLKAKNNIPENAVIIGISAANEWRKGFDFFLPLVSIYTNLFPDSNNICFIWKGCKEKSATDFVDTYDYKKMAMSAQVLLLPHDENSIDTMACFDIHLLLSREDPYPLVVLEAASFAIPTVSFLDAGGSPEFIENDAGFSVAYGDITKMAIKLNELVTDAALRKNMGLTAQKKLKQKHAPENTMPQFIKILEA